ncbi:pheromone-like peptide [Fomitiporia mediterranea MF3/22]|uniref:pheromone-like peptide n=1 Tax=Fomitiporia mediterranea (strain MF3/22) TaxID=694068 RepID=UPI0004409815|nr:pheromone-like peptide [Fomitiporia mediterranea MF3/22]EJC99834.1 pheromone-like peptide [Fomitiporia mediterranea MF3/22]
MDRFASMPIPATSTSSEASDHLISREAESDSYTFRTISTHIEEESVPVDVEVSSTSRTFCIIA